MESEKIRKQPIAALNPWNFKAEVGDRVYLKVICRDYYNMYDLRESNGRNKRDSGELMPVLVKKNGKARKAFLGKDDVWYWK